MSVDVDYEYLRLVKSILETGIPKPSRQGGTTRSLFAQVLRVPIGDLARHEDGSWTVQRFPVLSCKRVPIRAVSGELAWFLRGECNARALAAENIHIWDDDAAKAKARGFDLPDGELGPIYGHQWRRWGGDQVEKTIQNMLDNPYSRRHVISAWNADALKDMVLMPCHYAYQFVLEPVAKDKIRINTIVNMRSTDVGLGLPFNIASYALLTVLMCIEMTSRNLLTPENCPTEYVPGDLTVTMADCHVYEEHVPMLREMAEKEYKTAQTTVSIPESAAGVDKFAHSAPPRCSLPASYAAETKVVRMPLIT